MVQEQGYERIIDDEEDHYGNEGTSFENIVLAQMRRCVDVLSKDLSSRQIKTGGGMHKQQTILIEDTREQVINSVDTLRMLMSPFIDAKWKPKVKDLLGRIKKRRMELGNKLILVPGRGTVKASELAQLPADIPIYTELMEYKVKIHRYLFELLIRIYNAKRREIASWETE